MTAMTIKERVIHWIFFLPVTLWILVYGNRKFDRELGWTREAIKQWKKENNC